MQTKIRFLIATLAVTPAFSSIGAQHSPTATRSTTSVPREGNQFDFLVGQWELTVIPKVSGLAARIHGAPKLVGTWKAWRAFDGFGIEDELRIMDGSGNPSLFAHSMRAFNPEQRRWMISALDVYRSRMSTSSAEFKGAEMIVSGQSVDADGEPVLVRSRFHGITRDKFQYQQDRSTDNGRTWTEAVLKIEAKRTSATAPR